MFPVVAAAPAEHDKNSLLIGEMKEVFGLELAFKANGVQVHIADHAELIAQPVIVGAQEHVLRPAGAANEDRLAIDAEEAAAGGCEFGSDLADAEIALSCSSEAWSPVWEADGEAFEMRLAHLVGPPEFRIVRCAARETCRR